MKKLLLFGIATIATIQSHATNGYFSHGYGIKSKGRGGTSIAYSDDTFGGANNPASMVLVGDRVDVDVTLFSPIREANRTDCDAFGGIYNFSSKSKRNYFPIPEVGYNYNFSENLSLGVSVYANGGLNTSYVNNNKVPSSSFSQAQCKTSPANLLLGCGKLGLDLMQLTVAPVCAFRIKKFSFGIAPLLTYQRFQADGIQAFRVFSKYPNQLTNNHHDNSYGIGLRLGSLLTLNRFFSLGASYATESWMTHFRKYKGLFVDGGKFNVPQNFAVGIKIAPHSRVSLGFDFQRIFFHTIPSLGNLQSISLNFNKDRPLGSSHGSGFHWFNQNVYKFAFQVRPIDAFEFRLGWNYGKSPIRNGFNDITANILAPAVVENHLTLGADYIFAKGKGEIKSFYMHAFENTVKGPSVLKEIGLPGKEELKMYQNAFGIGFGWKW